MAQPKRIGTKTHKQGRREATPRTGRGTFPPHPSFSSNPPHKLPPNPQALIDDIPRRGRGRKTAVVPSENFRLRRELDAHNANSIVPDEVVLAWRRDYLNGKTAQEWVMYAKELNKPRC